MRSPALMAAVFVAVVFAALANHGATPDTPGSDQDRVGGLPATAATGSVFRNAEDGVPDSERWTVSRVVDGDTIVVERNGVTEKVRLIGINTPETVDPRRPVECFGQEASRRTKELLSGQGVTLESDVTQDDRDKYGRLLRYVSLEDGTDVGRLMVQEGFAYEYTYDLAYGRQADYREAESEARSEGRGLWAPGVCE